MKDVELAALAAAVDAERFRREASNAERQARGLSVVYTESTPWPEYEALRGELIQRGVVRWHSPVEPLPPDQG